MVISLRIPLEQPIFVPQSFIDSTIELFGPGERFSATFESHSNPTSNLERVVAGTEFTITQDPKGATVINAEIPELDMKTIQFVLMDGLTIDADRLDNRIEESSCEEDDDRSQEDGDASDSIVVNSSSGNNDNINANWKAGGNDDNAASWVDNFETAHENENYQNNVGDWANDVWAVAQKLSSTTVAIGAIEIGVQETGRLQVYVELRRTLLSTKAWEIQTKIQQTKTSCKNKLVLNNKVWRNKLKNSNDEDDFNAQDEEEKRAKGSLGGDGNANNSGSLDGSSSVDENSSADQD